MHTDPYLKEAADGEVLVRVDGVGKKFCRSLKKSLWYGVCDIASELNPFGRVERMPNGFKNLTTELTEDTEGRSGSNQRADSAEFLEGHSQACLQMDSQKSATIRNPNDSRSSEGQTGLVEKSAKIGEICGKNEGLRPGEFWAVQDVSFELRRGECLGLIGHNGAGKTTLLKMLNGLIKPDAGSITMRGRVGALIALGAGFNPILTGRENIYINGSVLGLTKKEIDEKIDEIIDFAEIREFIDMPVQSYSSGMTVRLGFAVATALDPDVLILDEVLAVGDGSFRHKCYQRIDSLRSRAAIIFVSHNMPDVGRICQSTVVMERGRTIFQGNALDGIARYNELNERGGSSGNSHREVRYPVREFSVEMPERVGFNEPLDFSIRTVSDLDVPSFSLSVEFANHSGAFVAAVIHDSTSFGVQLSEGQNFWNCRISDIPLKANCYYIVIHIIDDNGVFLATESRIKKIKVEGGHYGITADCQLKLISWKF